MCTDTQSKMACDGYWLPAFFFVKMRMVRSMLSIKVQCGALRVEVPCKLCWVQVRVFDRLTLTHSLYSCTAAQTHRG
jgi:hypothetical protein